MIKEYLATESKKKQDKGHKNYVETGDNRQKNKNAGKIGNSNKLMDYKQFFQDEDSD